MKLISILFAGAAKTTTGVVVTVATAATVVTTATVVHTSSLPVEQVHSAASAYVETLPEVSSEKEAQDLIEDTDRLEVQEPDDIEEPEQTLSQPAAKPQAQKPAPQANAAVPAPVQTDPATPVQPAPTIPTEERDSTPPEEASEKIEQTAAEDAVQPPAAIPQPDPKPQVQEQAPKVDAAATVPVQPAPEPAPAPQPEQKPAYEFSYHHTTSIYENDGTLIRVEYYDDNNKLTHYSKVEDHDPETNSYTENIYTYDEETKTEILQRTDVYEGSETEKAQ